MSDIIRLNEASEKDHVEAKKERRRRKKKVNMKTQLCLDSAEGSIVFHATTATWGIVCDIHGIFDKFCWPGVAMAV